MATTHHRKLSRKELKQPDEFVNVLDQIGDFVTDNLAQVIIGGAVVIIAVAIAFSLSFYFKHRSSTIAEQFYLGVNALSDKDYKPAQEDFTAVASGHSSLGHLAHFYLASTYLAQGQPASARKELQTYLANSEDRLFRQMALAELGVINEDLHAYADAHTAYVEAAQLIGPEKARAQVGAARTLALQGHRQEAIKAYQNFLNENPFAPERAQVIEALAQLGVAPENAASSGGMADLTGGSSKAALQGARPIAPHK